MDTAKNNTEKYATIWLLGLTTVGPMLFLSADRSSASTISSLNDVGAYLPPLAVIAVLLSAVSWYIFSRRSLSGRVWGVMFIILSVFFFRDGILYWLNCHFDTTSKETILTLSERTGYTTSTGRRGSGVTLQSFIFDESDVFGTNARVQVPQQVFEQGKPGKKYTVFYGDGSLGLTWISRVEEIVDTRPSKVTDVPVTFQLSDGYTLSNGLSVFTRALLFNDERENRYEYTYMGVLTNSSSNALQQLVLDVQVQNDKGSSFITDTVSLIPEDSFSLQPGDAMNVKFNIQHVSKDDILGTLSGVQVVEKEIDTRPASQTNSKMVDYSWLPANLQQKEEYSFEIMERIQVQRETVDSEGTPEKNKRYTYELLFEVQNTGDKDIQLLNYKIELIANDKIFKTHNVFPVSQQTPPLKPGESRVVGIKKQVNREAVSYKLRDIHVK